MSGKTNDQEPNSGEHGSDAASSSDITAPSKTDPEHGTDENDRPVENPSG